eukprot:4085167-Ditylum_brightwellii.AAC.1
MDLTPRNLGGDRAMYVDEEYMPFDRDEDKLYLKIYKPNIGELGELEVFELNSPLPDMAVE